jgi:hypothetical protein
MASWAASADRIRCFADRSDLVLSDGLGKPDHGATRPNFTGANPAKRIPPRKVRMLGEGSIPFRLSGRQLGRPIFCLLLTPP